MQNNFDKINNNSEGAKAPSIVMRKCCACGKIIDRKDLIRILKEHKSGKIIINPGNNDFGRSTYICKSEECLKLANKKKRLKFLSEEEFKILKNEIEK